MPNKVALKLSQVMSIAVAALALGFSGALSTPAVAQGRTSGETAVAEYQVIKRHAIAVRQSLIGSQHPAVLAEWAGIIVDLKSWGVRHAIPLGSDTASGVSSFKASGAAPAQRLGDRQCVLQHFAPPTKVPATIHYWVSSGVVTPLPNPTPEEVSNLWTLSCVYLVTPNPAPGDKAGLGGVEKAPTGNWDLKTKKGV